MLVREGLVGFAVAGFDSLSVSFEKAREDVAGTWGRQLFGVGEWEGMLVRGFQLEESRCGSFAELC